MDEFSLYVLDIVMNSLRAGATRIHITLTEEGDFLDFTVEDNGCGMTAEQIAKLSDPFYTTRTTRRVGLGVPFLKMLAEMTGGFVRVVSIPAPKESKPCEGEATSVATESMPCERGVASPSEASAPCEREVASLSEASAPCEREVASLSEASAPLGSGKASASVQTAPSDRCDEGARAHASLPETAHGTCITARFGRHHIDFLPLGDMAGTLVTLIQGAPTCDFFFRHTRDGGEVSLSTEEIRSVLGDGISLAEPEILAWIGENLREQYAALPKEGEA